MGYNQGSIVLQLGGIVQNVYNYVCACATSSERTNNDSYISKRLGIDKADHEFIMSLYWLLEDTNMAIEEFQEHQLQGPTRHKDNLGEKYLRLYGVLNAVNLQKSALIQLYELFKIPGKKQIQTKFKYLSAIELRNKTSAHALDYIDQGIISNFRISQHSISNGARELTVVSKNARQTFDLEAVVQEFCTAFEIELYLACVQIVDKVLPKNSKIHIDLEQKMNLIDKQIKGNIILDLPGGRHIILTSDPSALEEE